MKNRVSILEIEYRNKEVKALNFAENKQFLMELLEKVEREKITRASKKDRGAYP